MCSSSVIVADVVVVVAVVVVVVVGVQVIHTIVRIVRSNPFMTAMQVMSRLFLTWGILWLVPEVCSWLFLPVEGSRASVLMVTSAHSHDTA